MKKWVKVDFKRPAREEMQFVRFLCNYAGFQASKDEDRIPYKVRAVGRDWILVLKNGHAIYVPEFLTVPCRPAPVKRVYEETWEGN